MGLAGERGAGQIWRSGSDGGMGMAVTGRGAAILPEAGVAVARGAGMTAWAIMESARVMSPRAGGAEGNAGGARGKGEFSPGAPPSTRVAARSGWAAAPRTVTIIIVEPRIVEPRAAVRAAAAPPLAQVERPIKTCRSMHGLNQVTAAERDRAGRSSGVTGEGEPARGRSTPVVKRAVTTPQG
jgi:hypothetical protein